jgi:hypothetical protein
MHTSLHTSHLMHHRIHSRTTSRSWFGFRLIYNFLCHFQLNIFSISQFIIPQTLDSRFIHQIHSHSLSFSLSLSLSLSLSPIHKGSQFLGKCSITWVTPPILFALVTFPKVHVCAWAGLGLQSSYLHFSLHRWDYR